MPLPCAPLEPHACGAVDGADPAAGLRAAYLHACEWDVAVRKPGNVSDASAGHGMQAAHFRASALASAAPLFAIGARIGVRIEAAVRATAVAAGCNTNLGIVLLCAPLAGAAERAGPVIEADAWRRTVRAVLDDLDTADAAAAFRGIALANPGGLGRAEQQDVHAEPSIGLRDAMALAADRDLIARQYGDGFDAVFGTGLAALDGMPVDAAAVQRVFLALLGTYPDSHIVRKHGPAVAQTVMQAAQAWLRDAGPAPWDCEPRYAAWDLALKAARINPGTTADLTVATLMVKAALARGA